MILRLTSINFIKGINPILKLYKGGDLETSLPPSTLISYEYPIPAQVGTKHWSINVQLAAVEHFKTLGYKNLG